jgi:NADP-dependent aldehyde dehydrogenase
MHDTDHSADTIDRTTPARARTDDSDSVGGRIDRTDGSGSSTDGNGGGGSSSVGLGGDTVTPAGHTGDAASAAPSTRAAWLEAVADALDGRVDELVALADEESHLGTARLTGEVARTTGQLRLFAAVLRDGAFLEVVIDHADASATPPKPELRRMLRPTGPVAVFSASNFPFAFSVAGGDTASALAAGCPVIVKAHSAHPRLSRLTAAIVVEALRSASAPDGTFALVEGREQGTALVKHPAITAVGFTGSLAGGRSGRPRSPSTASSAARTRSSSPRPRCRARPRVNSRVDWRRRSPSAWGSSAPTPVSSSCRAAAGSPSSSRRPRRTRSLVAC